MTTKRLLVAGCLAISVLSPIALYVLTMAFGAEEWRGDDQPLPLPVYVIDGVFVADVIATILAIVLERRFRILVAIFTLPLLCLAAAAAFWGGLWVSGQWL
jgi:hypothetical protein